MSLRSRVMSGRLCTITAALCQPEESYQRRSRTLSNMFLMVMPHANFDCVKAALSDTRCHFSCLCLGVTWSQPPPPVVLPPICKVQCWTLDF